MEKLTAKEALEQGYKYCSPMYEETQLIPIENCDFSHSKGYELLLKEPTPYQISDDLLADLLDDYLTDQDEVMDETGMLNDIATTVSFKEVTDRLNEEFAKGPKYYYGTDIRLIQS